MFNNFNSLFITKIDISNVVSSKERKENTHVSYDDPSLKRQMCSRTYCA